MEVIKKIIKRKLRTSGTTTITLVPDTRAIYYFKLNLVSESHDWGFFDAFVENEETETQTEFDFTEVVIEEPYVPPERELVPIVTDIQVTTGAGYTVEYDGTDVITETITPVSDRGTLPYTSLETDLPIQN